jgi:serine/threonine protein kinase
VYILNYWKAIILTKLKKPIIFGTAFEVYSADQIIGEGGAGKVYFAKDEAGDNWAIKVLDPSKTSKEKLSRFKNEYSFCSRNQHKKILTITDYGLYWDEKEGR